MGKPPAARKPAIAILLNYRGFLTKVSKEKRVDSALHENEK